MRWFNLCSVNVTPVMRRLLLLLDSAPLEARSEPYFVLSVEAVDLSTGSRWDLKYKLEHSEWVAHRSRARRVVDSNFDLIMGDNLALRLQTSSRPDPIDDARPNIAAIILMNGDAWNTSVQALNIKCKTKVKLDGLSLSVGCQDRNEDEVARQTAVRPK
jgi:hypothetical protein